LAYRPPWHFRVAKYLIHHHLLGGYRLLDTFGKLGWLDLIVRYRLTDRVTFDVPLYRAENLWSEQDLQSYESEAIASLAEAVRERTEPVTFVDCGADIGLCSALLAARCPNLERVVAIEPNPQAFPILVENIKRLPLAGESHLAAVSDFSGQADLRKPRPEMSEHALFIVPTAAGSVKVTRVDDLELAPQHALVLKIDVEGEELSVLRGAVRSLSEAAWFAVLFEAHSGVMARTGIDPMECMRLLCSVRGCRFRVAEAPEIELAEDRPFFEQVSRRICNVVCLADDGRP
jgi:FkbM family methyltransferase